MKVHMRTVRLMPADRVAEMSTIRKSAAGAQHEDMHARLNRLAGKDKRRR